MRNIREFFIRYRRHLPTLALITGFVWDNFTLGRPDSLFDNAVMLFYLTLAGVGIILIQRGSRIHTSPRVWKLVLVQFAFGNLLSGLFVLYSTSGTLVGSWPFLLLIFALLIGNEFLKERYALLRFQISVFYLALFTYFALVFPIIFGKIGADIFLVSGFASITLIIALLYVLKLKSPKGRTEMYGIVIGIFTLMNVLYFLNVVPPVPLAMRDIGIFHSVERTENGYLVTDEYRKWYEIARAVRPVFQFTEGEKAYCFSAVFAPAKLNTPIYHNWEYYDEEDRAWKSTGLTSYTISGGRDQGFRGFTVKTVEKGLWRCSVETERGALIGRATFEAIPVTEEPQLLVEER